MTKKTDGKRAARRSIDTAAFQQWLLNLGLNVKPSLHINGHQYPSAILTVDFGQPLKSEKLNAEQNQELVSRMRSMARDVLGKDANVRIYPDNLHGIFYAAVA